MRKYLLEYQYSGAFRRSLALQMPPEGNIFNRAITFPFDEGVDYASLGERDKRFDVLATYL
jgi:hypothetical protein